MGICEGSSVWILKPAASLRTFFRLQPPGQGKGSGAPFSTAMRIGLRTILDVCQALLGSADRSPTCRGNAPGSLQADRWHVRQDIPSIAGFVFDYDRGPGMKGGQMHLGWRHEEGPVGEQEGVVVCKEHCANHQPRGGHRAPSLAPRILRLLRGPG